MQKRDEEVLKEPGSMDVTSIATIATAIGTFLLAMITYWTVKEMQLQQKRSRLTEEMSLLVGPLYSHKFNEMLFGITNEEPNRYSPEAEYRWSDYYNFWDNILTNNYLAPLYLRDSLNGYLSAKDAYWDAFGSHINVNRFERTALGKTKRETFELKRIQLIYAIDARYPSLTREIEQLEKSYLDRLLRR